MVQHAVVNSMNLLICRVHAANHGRRTTVMPKDNRLVREIISIYDPTSFLAIHIEDKVPRPHQIQQLPHKGTSGTRGAPPPPPPAPPRPNTGGKAPRKTTGGKAPRKTVPHSSNAGSGAARTQGRRHRTKQTAARSTGGKPPNVSAKVLRAANRQGYL